MGCVVVGWWIGLGWFDCDAGMTQVLSMAQSIDWPLDPDTYVTGTAGTALKAELRKIRVSRPRAVQPNNSSYLMQSSLSTPREQTIATNKEGRTAYDSRGEV